MTTINLRDYYPFYHQDVFVDVPDDLAAQLNQWERDENTYYVRRRRNRAHYSLDCGDGIENHILLVVDSPAAHYERELSRKQLHGALSCLNGKQAQRIYAHCVLGISKAEIARAEGISRVTVWQSIDCGLRRLKSIIENK